MFRPLAWTKTLALGFSSLLAITLMPSLMLLFIRGRLRPEPVNPMSRVTQAAYLPVLILCLRFPKTTGGHRRVELSNKERLRAKQQVGR
jgi:copper/silver efflux system protein